MKKKTILKIIVVLVLIFFGWVLFVRPKNYVKAARKIEVSKKVVERTVSSSGEIESRNDGDLAFGASGKIISIKVSEGDVVKKGELLATIDSYSGYKTAQSLKDARDYLIRTRDLFLLDRPAKVKAAGGETEYELELRQYNEKVDQAEASYQAQLGLLSNYYIYAPFDGTILDVANSVGEVAAATVPVIKIGDLNKFIFTLEVDQEDFGLVETGLPVRINLDSYPEYDFHGVVGELPYFAQSDTKSFEIEINISQDAEHEVRLGMEGDAYITLTSTGSEVSALTVDEIFYDAENNPYVWLDANGMLKKEFIETGLEGDIYIEVKSQLPNYVVVPIDDKDEFVEGFKVKLIN